MLLPPAAGGQAAQPEPGHPAPPGAFVAAPVAEMTATGPPSSGRFRPAGVLADTAVDTIAPQVRLSDASVRAGGCFVRALPLDGSCASAARRLFREAVAGADLPSDLTYDGITMASELAANTMNAHGNIEFGSHGRRPVSGVPEFWLYLRTSGSGREIVCKIFDSEPGWDAGEPLPVGAAVPAGPDSVRGRGLQLVAGLSAGRWGHHLTRGRLGSWKVQGKAVWFALRVPPGNDLARSQRLAPRGCRAIEELAAALERRGLGSGLVPVTESSGELAVLSVSQQLTVWCHGDILWWQEPDGHYDRLLVSDLVEAEERIVCAHEELIAARSGDQHSDTAVCANREAFSGEGSAGDSEAWVGDGEGRASDGEAWVGDAEDWASLGEGAVDDGNVGDRAVGNGSVGDGAAGNGMAGDGVGLASNGTGQVGARPNGVSLEKDRRSRPYDEDRGP